MASHTGQKWSTFFCFEIFLSELGTLFSRRGFQYSSRDLFYSIWDVLIQVEIFFSCRDFYLKSRIFSLVEIFIASREFFLSSRILSQVEIFFPVVNFFMPRHFHSSRDFNFFLVKIFFEICRHFSIQGESRDVCLHSLLVFPALDNHVIYRDTHYGGR